jgi:hypothetical protein
MHIKYQPDQVHPTVGPLPADRLLPYLRKAVESSRFKATFRDVSTSRSQIIKIETVRLLTAKEYCGNHPNACELPHGHGHRNRRTNYLEGADWVEFNDLLNDVLDKLHLAADVASSICVIRRGRQRRTRYGSRRDGRFWQWEKTGHLDQDYRDCCGLFNPPASDFPEGTPGRYKDLYHEVG